MNLIKQPVCNKAYRLVAVFNSNKLGYVFIHFSQSVLRAIRDYLYVHVVRFGKEDNRCLHDRSLQALGDCQVKYLHFHLSLSCRVWNSGCR